MNSLICILSFLLLLLVILKIMIKPDEGFIDSEKKVVICKADWCGHCKKAAPEFKKLKEASPITLPDGSKATVEILDADAHKEEIAKYSVKGYPSIFVMSGNDLSEYPGERTYDGVVEYLSSKL